MATTWTPLSYRTPSGEMKAPWLGDWTGVQPGWLTVSYTRTAGDATLTLSQNDDGTWGLTRELLEDLGPYPDFMTAREIGDRLAGDLGD